MEDHILEMLVHVPFATHKEPQKVAIVSENREKIEREIEKEIFLNLEITFTNDIGGLDSDSFDIAILDTVPTDDKIFPHLNRVLKKDGLVATRGDFQTLKNIAPEFRIAMPYLVHSLEKSSEILILASKQYHPTADIVLQRSDFLDGCHYYNSDTHIASFVMPNYIKKEIAQFVKN